MDESLNDLAPLLDLSRQKQRQLRQRTPTRVTPEAKAQNEINRELDRQIIQTLGLVEQDAPNNEDFNVTKDAKERPNDMDLDPFTKVPLRLDVQIPRNIDDPGSKKRS